MFQTIPLTYQTLYSELAQRSLDAAFSSDFSTDGRFIRQESRGRFYWYFDRDSGAGKKRKYVGPVDDPQNSGRVDAFKHLKADTRARRKLVSTLIREAYLPRPEQKSGDVVQALAEAGFFRLRGVLVGTIAYQCYSALVGVRLPDTAMQTSDVDFAQFHAISSEVGDTVEPVLAKLRKIDASFRDVPHASDGRFATQLVSSDGYRVDFLTPNDSSEDYIGRPANMPALGGIAAEPLRFLDYLIREPQRAVLLHGAGVPVTIPSPERFAVHKLIIATRRRVAAQGLGKSGKDRAQARNLMLAMIETRRLGPLADVFMEAWDRGPHWQEAIRESLTALGDDLPLIKDGLRQGVQLLDGNPGAYEL